MAPGAPDDRHPHQPHDAEDCARAWQTFRRAHDRVARRLTDDLARECALAMNDVDVLLHLRARAATEVRVGNLREAVPLSQPALSRLVARLEGRGLLARSDAADDGRAAVVRLTPAGEALLARAVEVHVRAVREALTSRLSEEDQATLMRTLSQVGA